MPNVPLNALRTFEAVARHRSFSRGAEELNVSTAAVSSQIRALEERLNQRLFRRQGRQITLTTAGRTLFPGVERGMREIRRAVQRLDAERSGGVLNVSMMPSFLQKWLMPRLGAFHESHQELDLRINADDSRVDFEQTDFHAAIRFGPGDAEGLVSEHLLDDWILPVCSPRYLDLHGPFEGPESLADHALLFVDSPVWDPWFETVGNLAREKRQKILNDALAILMAAELGEGIALTRWSLVARDLAAGRLVRPVDTLVPTDWSYYFTLPSHHVEMPKVQTFRRWLKEECDRFEGPTPVTA